MSAASPILSYLTKLHFHVPYFLVSTINATLPRNNNRKIRVPKRFNRAPSCEITNRLFQYLLTSSSSCGCYLLVSVIIAGLNWNCVGGEEELHEVVDHFARRIEKSFVQRTKLKRQEPNASTKASIEVPSNVTNKCSYIGQTCQYPILTIVRMTQLG